VILYKLFANVREHLLTQLLEFKRHF